MKDSAIQLKKALVVAGRIIPVYNKRAILNARKSYEAIWVEDWDGKNERCLLFTPYQLKVAEARAKKNAEDCTQKSTLVDLFD